MLRLLVEKYHGPMMQPAARVSVVDAETLRRLSCMDGIHCSRLKLLLEVHQDMHGLPREPFDVTDWLMHAPYDDYDHDSGALVVRGLWEPGTPLPEGVAHG